MPLTSTPRACPGLDPGCWPSSHATPLRVPLHPDLVLVARRRRDLLCRAHQTAAPAWGLPLDRGPPGRDQPLHHRRAQHRATALRLDRRSRSRPRRHQPKEASVGVSPLDASWDFGKQPSDTSRRPRTEQKKYLIVTALSTTLQAPHRRLR